MEEANFFNSLSGASGVQYAKDNLCPHDIIFEFTGAIFLAAATAASPPQTAIPSASEASFTSDSVSVEGTSKTNINSVARGQLQYVDGSCEKSLNDTVCGKHVKVAGSDVKKNTERISFAQIAAVN